MPYIPTGFAEDIFKLRYAITPEETFEESCGRESVFIANAETSDKRQHWASRFKDKLVNNKFSGGGRITYSAGRPKPGMINCFVIPTDDSREGWAKTFGDVTIISGLGGGVGINFSPIRPRGWEIRGVGGTATGSVSLMKAVNGICDILRGGGGRRAALLFCLRYDHPDIIEFLDVKLNKHELSLANISVMIDDAFLDAIENNGHIIPTFNNLSRIFIDGEEKIVSMHLAKDLKLPLSEGQLQEFGLTKQPNTLEVGYNAKEMWQRIIDNAWDCAEPGILNNSMMQRGNNTFYINQLICSNPCGEQMLPPYGSCDLGSINLAAHVKDSIIDYEELRDTVTVAVRYLDDVLDVTKYPLQEIEVVAKKQRRIGLGVMGLHHAMLLCGIKYNSNAGTEFASDIMNFIKKCAYEASSFLAVEKGVFPDFNAENFMKSGFVKTLQPSVKARIKEYGLRNAALLTCPPTGTKSLVADVSSGIEPIFAPAYRRTYWDGDDKKTQVVVDPIFKQMVQDGKSVKNFVGSYDIDIDWHLKIQEAIQKHVDSSISKTINFDGNKVNKEQLAETILKYIRNLKGLTVHRVGSREGAPLEPLSIEQALEAVKQESAETGVAEQKCKSGTCEI